MCKHTIPTACNMSCYIAGLYAIMSKCHLVSLVFSSFQQRYTLLREHYISTTLSTRR